MSRRKEAGPGGQVKYKPYGQARQARLGKQVRWAKLGEQVRQARLNGQARQAGEGDQPEWSPEAGWPGRGGEVGRDKQAAKAGQSLFGDQRGAEQDEKEKGWSNQLENRSNDPWATGNEMMSRRPRNVETTYSICWRIRRTFFYF